MKGGAAQTISLSCSLAAHSSSPEKVLFANSHRSLIIVFFLYFVVKDPTKK